MAKKDKIEEEALAEEQNDEDVQDPGGEEGEEEERKGIRSFGRISGLLKHFLPPRLKGRWILASLSALAILGLGWAVVSGRVLTPAKVKETSQVSETRAVPVSFYEEALSPFFIPLHPESAKGVMRVDFSMIWDGVAAIRFKKRELQIRESVYEHLATLANKKKDINERTSYLESEIRRVIRESLGRDDLEVKIRKIKAF